MKDPRIESVMKYNIRGREHGRSVRSEHSASVTIDLEIASPTVSQVRKKTRQEKSAMKIDPK